MEHIVEYSGRWGSIVSLCVSNNKVFGSHDEGITVVDIQLHACHTIYKSQNAKCITVPFKQGILFSDQQKATLYQTDEENNIEKFAGSETKGCQDGPVATCKFKKIGPQCGHVLVYI